MYKADVDYRVVANRKLFSVRLTQLTPWGFHGAFQAAIGLIKPFFGGGVPSFNHYP
jgi:hypothetical protein